MLYISCVLARSSLCSTQTPLGSPRLRSVGGEELWVVLTAWRHLFASHGCTSKVFAVILWFYPWGPLFQSLVFPSGTYILSQGSLNTSLCRDNDPFEDIDRHVDTGVMLW